MRCRSDCDKIWLPTWLRIMRRLNSTPKSSASGCISYHIPTRFSIPSRAPSLDASAKGLDLPIAVPGLGREGRSMSQTIRIISPRSQLLTIPTLIEKAWNKPSAYCPFWSCNLITDAKGSPMSSVVCLTSPDADTVARRTFSMFVLTHSRRFRGAQCNRGPRKILMADSLYTCDARDTNTKHFDCCR